MPILIRIKSLLLLSITLMTMGHHLLPHVDDHTESACEELVAHCGEVAESCDETKDFPAHHHHDTNEIGIFHLLMHLHAHDSGEEHITPGRIDVSNSISSIPQPIAMEQVENFENDSPLDIDSAPSYSVQESIPLYFSGYLKTLASRGPPSIS